MIWRNKVLFQNRCHQQHHRFSVLNVEVYAIQHTAPSYSTTRSRMETMGIRFHRE